MDALYHITSISNLKSIMDKGLLPSANTKIHNTYQGISGNPNYIYFWNKAVFNEFFNGSGPVPREFYNTETKSILEIQLPNNYNLEKDYDQLLVYLNLESKGFSNSTASRLRINMITGFELRSRIKFEGEFNKENIIKYIDSISDEVWDNSLYSYRSKDPIESNRIKVVQPQDLVPGFKIKYLE